MVSERAGEAIAGGRVHRGGWPQGESLMQPVQTRRGQHVGVAWGAPVQKCGQGAGRQCGVWPEPRQITLSVGRMRCYHIPTHSQRTERVTGSCSGSLKVSCSTLQVILTPSAWLVGTKV